MTDPVAVVSQCAELFDGVRCMLTGVWVLVCDLNHEISCTYTVYPTVATAEGASVMKLAEADAKQLQTIREQTIRTKTMQRGKFKLHTLPLFGVGAAESVEVFDVSVLPRRNPKDETAMIGTATILVSTTAHKSGVARIAQLESLVRSLSTAKETAVTAAKRRADFLAMMSHEIRTPMNGIFGMTQLMLTDKTLVEPMRTDVTTIFRSVRSLLQIVNRILDFAKLESDMVKCEPGAFNVRDLLGELVTFMTPSLNNNKNRLDKVVAQDVPERIVSDATYLYQVLINLVSNAIKFTVAGTVTLSCTLSSNGKNVLFAVTDTGIGIDPQLIKVIFEPFLQEDTSATRVYGGTGLGLAIAHRLVGLMGGTLSVESTKGKGSRFWFELPLKVASPSMPMKRIKVPGDDLNGICDLPTSSTGAGAGAAVAPECKVLASLKTNICVLVAEDNVINQRVLVRMLTHLGWKSKVAHDGIDAVSRVRAKPDVYRIILMDLHMPHVDGVTASKIIRTDQADRPQAFIVAVTADVVCTKTTDVMDAFLPKPICMQALQDVMKLASERISAMDSGKKV